MNAQQYEILKKFESNFKTVTESKFTRNIALNDRKTIVEVYRQISNNNQHINYSCGSCFQPVLQYLAPLYFAYKERIELKENDNGYNQTE